MRFRILGPVDCATGSGELLATGQRQQKLLAALLLDAGRAVSTDTLISIVWDDWPATARSSTRIDCVSVTWTEQDRERHRRPRVGRHISPRDPILQRPAKHYHDYRPGCVRCWE